jgi:hypothetical protein
LYDYPDLELLWAEIQQAVASSPFYTPGDTSADVTYPPYYTLGLRTNCDGDTQQVVAVLREGESACDPQVPRRDILWLQNQLWRAGLIQQGEILSLAPENCTDNCRLEVIQVVQGTAVGNIQLEANGASPGEVYRADGEAGERWRLRGDLTWERVPE